VSPPTLRGVTDPRVGCRWPPEKVEALIKDEPAVHPEHDTLEVGCRPAAAAY